MSLIKLQGNASGTGAFTIAAPNGNTDRTLTLPDATGTVTVAPAGAVNFTAAPSGAMTLDASGNAGLGVTPSAWRSAERAFDLGANSALADVAGATRLYNNAYTDATPTFRYKTTRAASFYLQDAGAHYWYNAPSGTAGNPISFTQAMTLDAAGRLSIPNQPHISYRITQATTDLANQLVPWDTLLSASGISYNSTTRRFTVPVAGRYLISGSFFKSGATGSSTATARVLLGWNTDAPSFGANHGSCFFGQGSAYSSMSFQVILNMAANDYFTFLITNEGGIYSRTNDYFNYMTAQMIG